MNVQTKTCALIAIAFSFVCFYSHRAAAYNYPTCNGYAVGWDGKQIMARDQCSMPDNSSARYGYDSAGWNWRQISDQIDWNWTYNTGCLISLGDGLNETALVNRSRSMD